MKRLGLLLAAGQSSRMRGRDKQLELIDGQTLLSRLVEVCRPHVDALAVTIPHIGHARQEALRGYDVVILPIPDAHEGMSASLRTAAAWARLQTGDHLMILPSDMPDLDVKDIELFQKLVRNSSRKIVQATSQSGIPGHPVSFPKETFTNLGALSGDNGAKSMIAAHASVTVALTANHAITDLDTPEDWDMWRLERSNSTNKH